MKLWKHETRSAGHVVEGCGLDQQLIQHTYVRYTIDSLPLFDGTVSSAFGSSTMYWYFVQSEKWSYSQSTSSFFWLATTKAFSPSRVAGV